MKQSAVSDPNVQSWLNEFTKPKTQYNYQYGINVFFEYITQTPTELLGMQNKDVRQTILQAQKDMVEANLRKGKTAVALIAIRSFLTSNDKQIKFKPNQIIKAGADNSSHVFTNGDLNRLMDVGGAMEKAILATACSQGWEISMFLQQERKKVEDRIAHAEQNNEPFVFFMDKRDKTSTPRFCVLNPLAIECIKRYLAVRQDKDKRLFPITQDGIQKMFHRLAKDANLKTTGPLRFHNIRKWLMSRLSRCNFNEFQIKFIMGKSIGISDLVYLQTLQSEIEEKYPTVYNDYLNICYKPQLLTQKDFTPQEIKRIKALLEAFEAKKITFTP